MNTKQTFGPTGTTQMLQDGPPVTERIDLARISFFVQMRLGDQTLFSLALDLLATTGTDQVLLQPCRRCVVDTQVMELEQGVLVSFVLPDTQESVLALKAWAIRAVNQLGADDLRFFAHEVHLISASTQNNNAVQLSFDSFDAFFSRL